MNSTIAKTSHRIAILLIVLLAIPVFYFSLFVPFETDTGDSVVHYFFARYAFQNPVLFLDHWAKPFFTLLASPFAQFGFSGMKLFNGLAGLLSAWLAYMVARKLSLKFAWLGIVFVLFAPAYFVKLFSGYTEPLFGLMLVASVYLVLIQLPFPAAILISFLPFVRSEGLILIGVFALYFLLRRNYKAIIFLAAGHLVYSFTGFIAGKDFLWIFTEIPYKAVSIYGKGDFSHYPTQLLLTLGVPLFVLSIAGVVILLLSVITPKIRIVSLYISEIQLLVLGSFLAYFGFHTLSWGLGLFGSMGLSRVLTAMVPLSAIMALIGLDYLMRLKLKGKVPLSTVMYILVIGYVVAFPFLHNPASINFKKELQRTPEMKLMHTIADDIKTNYSGKFLYYSNPYLSYALAVNPFDQSRHLCFTDWQAENKLNPNSLVIWDSWFSVVEEQTDSVSLYQNPDLYFVKRYETGTENVKNVFLVFRN